VALTLLNLGKLWQLWLLTVAQLLRLVLSGMRNDRLPSSRKFVTTRRGTTRFKIVASTLATIILLAGALAVADDSSDEKRDKTRKMAAETLKDLYKLEPAAKAEIQKAAGYAVFNNTGATTPPR
jgi:hypothetical protein